MKFLPATVFICTLRGALCQVTPPMPPAFAINPAQAPPPNFTHFLHPDTGDVQWMCLGPGKKWSNDENLLKFYSWDQLNSFFSTEQWYFYVSGVPNWGYVNNYGDNMYYGTPDHPLPESHWYDPDLCSTFHNSINNWDGFNGAGPARFQDLGITWHGDLSQHGAKLCCSLEAAKGYNAALKSRTYAGVHYDDWPTTACDCGAAGHLSPDETGKTCCSQRLNGSACACIPPLGRNLPDEETDFLDLGIIDVVDSDCCYNGAQSEGVFTDVDDENQKKCGKRKCAHKDESVNDVLKICCWKEDSNDWNRSGDLADEVCKCTPHGSSHHAELAASGTDCCSGSYSNLATRTCGCIEANIAVSADEKSSCCSGDVMTIEGVDHCKEDSCTGPGFPLLSNGAHCCVDTGLVPSGGEQVCPCKMPGATTNREDLCCSGSFDINGSGEDGIGKCEYWLQEDDVPEHISKDVCYSGEFEPTSRKCACVPAGANKFPGWTHPDNAPDICCSGRYVTEEESEHRHKCSCVHANHEATSASLCCSKRRGSDGLCKCGLPGAPVEDDLGMRSNDCCSGRAHNGFCQCYETTESGVVAVHPEACCSEVNSAGECPCIAGYSVIPSTERANPGAVCCNPDTPSCSDVCLPLEVVTNEISWDPPPLVENA